VFAGGADLPRVGLDLDDELSADDIALVAAAEPDEPAMSNASAALAVAAWADALTMFVKLVGCCAAADAGFGGAGHEEGWAGFEYTDDWAIILAIDACLILSLFNLACSCISALTMFI
jgi:hypothetical protein